MIEPSRDVTTLLAEVSAGNTDAWDALLKVVYRELHSMAHVAMRQERRGQTLQTTALVNEAYLRLVRDKGERWRNRGHFFSVAAKAMRHILVDRYRAMKAAKRGGGQHPLSLEQLDESQQELECVQNPFNDWEALDKALNKLGEHACHRRKCTIVELRFFVGLTHTETAEVLDVSAATVKRDWEFTRAWLRREMEMKD